MEKFYSIHNVVKFKIYYKRLEKWKYTNIFNSFKNFETDFFTDGDFEVTLGKFSPENCECQIIDNRYFIRDDYFYCLKDEYKIAQWEFEIKGFESNNLQIRISSNLFGYMWISGFIIDFFVHYLMNERGYPIIHSSCVADLNGGILFSTRGGGGKTTLSLTLLDKGYKFLGDNFVILNKGNILSYFSQLNLFSYNLIPIIKQKMGISGQISLKLKEIMYALSGNYIKIFTKINPKTIFPDNICDTIKLNKCFIILPKKGIDSDKIAIIPISAIDFCKMTQINQQMDTLLFLPYLLEFKYVVNDSKMGSHWERYYSNLLKNISPEIQFFIIEVPMKYDDRTMKQLLEVIT